jgi:hypothetical protein
VTLVALRFRIAGVRFELSVPEGAVRASLQAAWRAFATDEAPDEAPDTRIEVDVSRGARPEGGWAMTLPEPHALPDGGLGLRREDFSAEVAPDRTRAVVRGFSERYPVESLVKVLLAERLLSRGGLLVHGVAVAHAGGAALFSGPSGAGKSTLGRYAGLGGLAVLSDELVAVSPVGDGGYLCEGTPWNVGLPAAARLRCFGELAWEKAPRLVPREASALLRLLLPNAVMPDASPAGRARMFKAASALLSAVRPVRLAFAPDPGVAAVLARALEAA